MVAVHVQEYQQNELSESTYIYYMERILELLKKRCIAQAKSIFEKYHTQIEELLPPDHFKQLCERILPDDDWSIEKEEEFFELLDESSYSRNHVDIHDYAHELLLHIDNPSANTPSQESFDRLNLVLAKNNGCFIEPNEVKINTFIDADVEFVVEKRRAQQDENKELKGNPGFYLRDSLNKSYQCFIKQVSNVEVGDSLKLKITNIPGNEIDSRQSKETIVYLEPRTMPGELIEVEVMNLSHTGNSFTFRHHSYDGFLWFKRRGVNKEQFNVQSIKPKDKILAKVLYTSEEAKYSHRGQITRLGIIKAVPLKRL